ncbi:MAG: sigma-70 family RNA polymerase sigma factor [Pirellulales bacterium]
MDDQFEEPSLDQLGESLDDPRFSMLRGLSNGEERAYVEFWRRYGDRLRALADARLPAYLQNRLEADDVVQSACRSFFRRVTGGELTLSDSENLWRLLCAMTLNKVRMQIRYHMRQRRSPRREVPLETPAESSTAPNIQPAAAASTPEELAMFAEQLEQLMSALSDEERRMVELKLQDYSGEEIASRLNCSERTVRRLLQRVRDRWQTYLRESLGADPAS